MKHYCYNCNKSFEIDPFKTKKYERREVEVVELTCPYCNDKIYIQNNDESYSLPFDSLLSLTNIKELEEKEVQLLREFLKLEQRRQKYIKHLQKSGADISEMRSTSDIIKVGLDEENNQIRHYRSKRHM